MFSVALKTPLEIRLRNCIYKTSFLHRPDDYIGFTPSCPPHILQKVAPMQLQAKIDWIGKPCSTTDNKSFHRALLNLWCAISKVTGISLELRHTHIQDPGQFVGFTQMFTPIENGCQRPFAGRPWCRTSPEVLNELRHKGRFMQKECMMQRVGLKDFRMSQLHVIVGLASQAWRFSRRANSFLFAKQLILD